MAKYIVEWEYKDRPSTRRSVTLKADDAEQALSALKKLCRRVNDAQGKTDPPIVIRQIYRAGPIAEVLRQSVQEKLGSWE